MSDKHRTVIQNLLVDAVALGTLGARSSINLNATFVNPGTTFLVLKVRYLLQLVGRTLTDDGPVAVMLANGNASTAEVAAALTEINTTGLADATQMLTQDEVWMVWQQSLRVFKMSGDGTEGFLATGWMSPGGRNGMPAVENGGVQVSAVNLGSGALATGSSINGIVQLKGVWMRD